MLDVGLLQSAGQPEQSLHARGNCTIIACALENRLNNKISEGKEMRSFLQTLMAFFVVTALIGMPTARAGEIPGQFALLVELEIDPAQLDAYKAAMKEVIDASITEPGVLSLNSAAEKDNPARIHFFEVYSNADAWKAHLETPHIKKYVAATKDMVKSRKRTELTPLILVTK
jgi:quinol monooxygenase YgiN